jgi:hypothetical protein
MVVSLGGGFTRRSYDLPVPRRRCFQFLVRKNTSLRSEQRWWEFVINRFTRRGQRTNKKKQANIKYTATRQTLHFFTAFSRALAMSPTLWFGFFEWRGIRKLLYNPPSTHTHTSPWSSSWMEAFDCPLITFVYDCTAIFVIESDKSEIVWRG